MILDLHAHLEMCENPEKAIKNAKDILIVGAGVDFKTNKKVLDYAEKFSNVRACLGMYPIDVLKLSDKEIEGELKFIEDNKDKIVGIGEVGIDLKESEDFEKQKNNFLKIISLSKKLNKPLIVHSRKAEKEVVDILEKEKCKKVVMHCFSGNFKLVKRILDNGWYLTIPTCVKRSEHFQKVVEMAPIENLFCETDSPFLHPDGERNNEPKNVIESYKKIAEIKQLTLKDVEKKIEGNFKRLFV
jgi:TatD DNase family protein